MGIIFGKFGKKKNTFEILEKLEKEIVSIEEFSKRTEKFRKKVITRFILLAILIYFILACFLYFYYHQISSNQKLLYIVPLLAFPFIVIAIKKFLAWYYSRKLNRNEMKLVKLKEEKKKILENVMEKETYKVAKQILDKYGNDTSNKNEIEAIKANSLVARNNQVGLRQRNIQGRLSIDSVKTPISNKLNPITTPSLPEKLIKLPNLTIPVQRPSLLPSTPQFNTRTPLPLPRSILPSNSSVLDKMVDYLVGDGPSNRYALICKKCSSHNGMALKEEFEYLSFKCCYCSHFNAARKKKASGPTFEEETSKTSSSIDDSDSDVLENETVDSPTSKPEESDQLPSQFDQLPVDSKETPIDDKKEDETDDRIDVVD
ncbi:endoplasmic reticulum junction formation protein lunapark [Diorhabda carinulata]|uniref:endoplasmic reticulum junction formation protein lunapark n=1 Tax=Diorhabda carinulata TaxID=1163345 RepID=UPI0025A01F5F|nr:endoplasmic reticulum junction formation protein lunapark [Diorhabda carinulata]XP_057655740.1 endoplasmic reticulum junction formation protein lunapark [Diorhabda carinulata]XP_057655741.1 endoplasmic reticulum junction formation protein lunapark [Diorhabda carinulata]